MSSSWISRRIAKLLYPKKTQRQTPSVVKPSTSIGNHNFQTLLLDLHSYRVKENSHRLMLLSIAKSIPFFHKINRIGALHVVICSLTSKCVISPLLRTYNDGRFQTKCGMVQFG